MSAVQIVGIGDSHINHRHPLNPQRLRSLDAILEYGYRLPNLGAWWWCGDIFDERSTAEDRNTAAHYMKRFADRAPVIVPQGNYAHDLPGELRIFGQLAAAWPIYIVEDARVLTFMLATGQLMTMFVLAHPNDGGLLVQGVAPADLPAAAKQRLDVLFIDAGDQLTRARGEGSLTGFAAHITIMGSVASTGQDQSNLGMEIDGAMLARLGDCPKLTGHVHKPQEVGGAIVIGSNARNNYGELEDKRFIVVHFDEDGDFQYESVPLDVPPMGQVEAKYADGEFTYRMTKGPGSGEDVPMPPSFKGWDIKCRVEFPQSERRFYEVHLSKLYAFFAETRRLTLDPVCIPDRALRAPEVAAARTLDEKVDAWARLTSTVFPEIARAMLARLQSTDPEQLLADVDEEIAALIAPRVESEAMVA